MDGESSSRSYRTQAVRKIHWLPRIALAAFVVGSMAVAAGFLTEGGFGRWTTIGVGFWILAYFLILLDIFQRKIPYTSNMNRVIRHEDKPIEYMSTFIFALVFGVFGLLMFVAVLFGA